MCDRTDECEPISRRAAYGPALATTLQTNDQILTPDDWNNQIIAYRNGGPIRVSDVGKAIIDHRIRR